LQTLTTLFPEVLHCVDVDDEYLATPALKILMAAVLWDAIWSGGRIEYQHMTHACQPNVL
jgi:hypothetical protein